MVAARRCRADRARVRSGRGAACPARWSGELVRHRCRARGGPWCCGRRRAGPPGPALAAAGRRAAASPSPVRSRPRSSHPSDPVELAVLRWVPTVPGYLVAIVGDAAAGRPPSAARRGRALAVEVALFLVACLVVVSLLVVGPAGRWSQLELDEQVVLGAAVLVTSATMAAALTLLGRHRGQPAHHGRGRSSAAPSCSPSAAASARPRCCRAPPSRSGAARFLGRRRPAPAGPRRPPRRAARTSTTPTGGAAVPSTSGSCCRTSPCSPRSRPSAASR